ncbi:MAG TPA: DciA family protein [Acidobacteriaceae bacterium]
MRDVLRGTLGRSLRGIGEEDRLAAAWTVACGCAMADHGRVLDYEAGVVRIEVADPVWLRQMLSLRSVLERELARVAGLKVTAIEFVPVKKPHADGHRGHRSTKQNSA